MKESFIDLAVDDLTVARGRFVLGPLALRSGAGRVALIGVNGAGKSTLISALVGSLRHRGRILVDEQEVPHLPPRRTGLVNQQPAFPGLLTVRECVAGAAELKGVAADERDHLVEEALTVVDLVSDAGRRASRLSGGQQRRLACAQAVVHRPGILLLDEPTAGLDPIQRQRIRDFLARRPDKTLTIVTTHILEDVAEWADRFLVLDGGTLTADISREDLPEGRRAAALEAMLLSPLGALP